MAHKEKETRPDWELSNIGLMLFTSLMIILLAFFIMLSSMAVIDEQSQKEAWGSLLGAFGILPGGLSASQDDGTHVAPPTSPLDVIQADLEHIRDVLSSRASESKIRFLRGKTRRIISLGEAALFPPDEVGILPEMKPLLLDICRILKESGYPIIIEGHTDDQPPQSENLIDNWHVSCTRAYNIFSFFVKEGGLDPARLTAYGYAGNKPAVANTSPRNRARNRRIDLILDQSHRMKVLRYKERLQKPRFFDFRGFTFSITGGEVKP